MLSGMDYLVEEARYVRDYVIWRRFRDGTAGEVGLHDTVRGNRAPPPTAHRSDTPGVVLMTETDDVNHTVGTVPVISRFFGIVISMYHREHGVPHFHARHGEHWIAVEIESGVIHGSFPKGALRHVSEWASLHREELLINWRRARRGDELKRIPPME